MNTAHSEGFQTPGTGKRSSGYFNSALHGLKPWGTHSQVNPPAAMSDGGTDYFENAEDDEKAHKAEWQRKLKKRAKEKRKKEEIYVS